MTGLAAVDVHAHLAPADRLEAMRERSPETTPLIERADPGIDSGAVFFRYPDGTINGPVPSTIVDLDRRLAEMDAANVAHQALSTRPQMFDYSTDGRIAAELARLANETLVDVARRHPERFSALIALPMQDTERAVAEVEHWAPHPEVRGAMVDSNIEGRDFAEPAFAPIWAALEAADTAVLVHPYQADVVGMDRLRNHYLFNLVGNPLDTTIAIANVVFGGLVERYPALRWGFVHGGGVAPYLIGRWDHGWRQREVTRALIPDRLPSELLRTFWYDCIVHDRRTLAYLGEMAGWDRIMVGSDCPFDMGDSDPVGFVDGSSLDPPIRAAVLRDNALAFLRPR